MPSQVSWSRGQPPLRLHPRRPDQFFGWTTLGIGTAALVAGVAGAQLWPTNAALTPAPVNRFTIELPEKQAFTNVGRSVVAVSSDGRQIAYVADDRIYVRPVGEFESRVITGTAPGEGINSPVFSPDGRALAYVSATENAIKRIPIEGGTPFKICDVVTPLGVTWFENDLFFGAGVNGIMRVSINGGVPERIAEVPDTELAYGPQLLPGGKAVLFSAIRRVTAGGSAASSSIILQPLPSGPRKTLVVDGGVIRYVPTGYLLFAQGGMVVAQAFSLERMEFTGAPVPVLQGVRRGVGANQALTQFAVSDAGTVAYLPVQPACRRSHDRSSWPAVKVSSRRYRLHQPDMCSRACREMASGWHWKKTTALISTFTSIVSTAAAPCSG